MARAEAGHRRSSRAGLSVPLVVQLDLDAMTASSIDQVSGALEGYVGVETIRQLGSVPHVSLAVYDDFVLGKLPDDLAAFAKTLSALPLKLVNLGIFTGSRNVLFAAPVVTEQLLAIHQRFHQTFTTVGSCSEHFRPGAWVPHVTLAMNMSLEILPDCVGELPRSGHRSRPSWTPSG